MVGSLVDGFSGPKDLRFSVALHLAAALEIACDLGHAGAWAAEAALGRSVMHGVAVLRSVLCACPSVPFRPRLFLILHVLFGPVCFVSVRTFLVLAGVPLCGRRTGGRLWTGGGGRRRS